MGKIRLYIDEDAIIIGLVQALQNANIDVITTSEADRLSFTDEEQLIWATTQNRVIYSFNRRDFSILHNQFLGEGKTHSGIVLVQQQRYSIGQQLRGLLKLIANKSAEEMRNRLEFLGSYIGEK